jgi:peptidoglycan/LPS O-acetylase OafA/YrhL
MTLLQSGSPAPGSLIEEAGPGPAGRVFHTLDALRGIAALGVVVFHMSQMFAPLAAPGGYLAVDLFFMMSGVVLSHAYEGRFRAGMGTIDFMRARLIRLYPLYLLGSLIGIAVTFASLHGRNIQNWDTSSLTRASLLSLFFLPNFSTTPVDALFPLNIPCWSLFLEILVNLLFVIFWPLLTSRRLIATSVLTGAVVAVAIAHKGSIDQGTVGSSIAVGLARAAFGFSVGVLIARRIRQVHPRKSNLGVVVILMAVGVAIAARPGAELRPIWDAVCVLLVFPSIVWCGTAIDPGPLLRRPATFLGVTSYAIYVLHTPLSAIVNSATRALPHGLGAPFLGVAIAVLLMLGCWLVDRYFDMPLRRVLGRIVPKIQKSGAFR